MIIIKQTKALKNYIIHSRSTGATIGFVPTMGALHNGHLELIRRSKANSGLTVCSIFVNPTQFNDPKDFEKYPITIENDIDLLEQQGCDVLFLPDVAAIYPQGMQHLPHYELGFLETILEGKYRPGHFQGVCQVVHRLLNAVQPDHLYMGQKDYQQCMVIKKLIELEKLPVAMIVVPTVRETDGLAMSSRNMRLSAAERKKAVQISATLQFIKREIKPGELETLRQRCQHYLTAEGFRPDYVAIADADTLHAVDDWDGKQQLVALIAAYLNEVRLIDNMLLQ
ncbi:MAG: pantoate--beta-alanine ligase [Bacteroidetes bacterium]|nr:pantoate--beta-alanine ligase [Bacteroidota bacterium]